ncbi:unnamed protein product [Owenia fusiformis]|uniref:Uncharacterized protein n=1 Tax=Owenia fusiformis TaxID=6347 RepID=A0A8J1U1X8_OWEFU|nr:unnamed protein product [Owenia fusiformis]
MTASLWIPAEGSARDDIEIWYNPWVHRGGDIPESFGFYIERNNENLETLREISQLLKSSVEKRKCGGFPCIYSQLGAKMGQASLHAHRGNLMQNCMNDPYCSPGRR